MITPTSIPLCDLSIWICHLDSSNSISWQRQIERQFHLAMFTWPESAWPQTGTILRIKLDLILKTPCKKCWQNIMVDDIIFGNVPNMKENVLCFHLELLNESCNSNEIWIIDEEAPLRDEGGRLVGWRDKMKGEKMLEGIGGRFLEGGRYFEGACGVD